MIKAIKRKKLIIISCIALVLTLVVIPCIISVFMYEQILGIRYQTSEIYKNELSDFEGLQAERHTFTSNKNQTLVGYTYYKDTPPKNAVVVIAHGLGDGGHNRYMDIADYFASNGYYVFSYDATGNDESEGKSVIGLSQGLVDLDYALEFIKQDQTLKDMQIMLFGHSWGGYAVSSVLNIHKDIKAVVSVSGFNKPIDMLKERGNQMAGKFIYITMPYLSIYENVKFGKYAFYNSISGFENSTAKVMVIHSANDSVVSIKNSYDVYYDKFKDNSRFTFVRYEDKGHNYIYYSDESLEYIGDFYTSHYEYVTSKNGKITEEENEEYFKENFNKKLAFVLDPKLMGNILSFYDSCLTDAQVKE